MRLDEVQRHSPTAQAAYRDLLSLLLDDVVGDIRGLPTPRQRSGRTYWYDRYRLGSKIAERYLGEDSPALRTRLESHLKLRESRQMRQRERARLVRLLRSERYLGLDARSGSLISALGKAGVFRVGGVLVGTSAFRLYEGELGLLLSVDQMATTNDIDIASFEKLSLAIGETIFPPIETVMKGFDFEPVPSLDRGKVWCWSQAGGALRVEFLTPSFDADEGLRELAALGVSAQSLHYLNFLIADPIYAAGVYRDGVLTRIPRPERFAIHKLIVADRRLEGPDSAKAIKDVLQAELLMGILAEDRPNDLLDAYETAMATGQRWRERLGRSLRRSGKATNALAVARRYLDG